MVMGMTGAGKSYFVNALLGCQTPDNCGLPSISSTARSAHGMSDNADCAPTTTNYAAVSGKILHIS